MKLFHWASIAVLLLVAVTLQGCTEKADGLSKKSADDETPLTAAVEEVVFPVQVAAAERGSISEYLETTARIQAETRVEVVAKGSGHCLEVLVEEGDRVKEGQVLARLDSEDIQVQIQQTQVNIDQIEFQLDVAKRSATQGIGTPYDSKNLEFQQRQTQSNLKIQQVQLNNQTIRSPISGVITSRQVQKGILVGSGTPVFSIMDPDSYILPIQPPERELSRLHVGQEAMVRIDSVEEKEFVAKVRLINPGVDPVSGTVKVTLDFEKEDRAALRESAFARVRLVMDTHDDVLIVPKDVILEENARNYIMVIREELPEDAAVDAEPRAVARRVEVKLGLSDSERAEVISGLEDNDRFVTQGQYALKDGVPVQVTDVASAISANLDLSTEDALVAAKEKRFDIGNGHDRREKHLRN